MEAVNQTKTVMELIVTATWVCIVKQLDSLVLVVLSSLHDVSTMHGASHLQQPYKSVVGTNSVTVFHLPPLRTNTDTLPCKSSCLCVRGDCEAL